MSALPQPRLPRFVPFGAPKFSPREERAVVRTMRTGWVGMGPKTIEFEHAFASYVSVPHAVSMSSCTAALHASLLVAGVGPGHEVITTPLTFVATANAILMTGAKVRLADVDADSYNLSPVATARAINHRTKAIMPVHFGGLPADLNAFRRLARPRGLTIVEDAAHAVGARYHGRPIGASGNLVCFSFYPNKNITTIEGGMVTLQSARVARQLSLLRLHGLDADAWRRFHRRSIRQSLAVVPGFKYNLTDLQSAIGLEQLRHLETWQRRRERYAAIYDAAFRRIPGVGFQARSAGQVGDRHALHLYTLRLDQTWFGANRDAVVHDLLRRNVGASIHYTPIHLHPLFRQFGYRRGDFPISEQIGREIFTLPLTPHLSESTIVSIARITTAVLRRYRRRA